MKTIFTTATFLLLNILAFSQPQLDTIIVNGGHESIVRIVDEDQENIYFILNKVRKKVAKNVVVEVKKGVEYELIKNNSRQSIKMVEIIDLDRIKKNEIFVLSKEWIINSFRNPFEVIQLDDRDLGKIVGIGSYEISNLWNNLLDQRKYLRFHFRISVKDFKLRIIMENMFIETYNLNGRIKSQSVKSLYWEKNGSDINFHTNRKKQINLACESILLDFIFFLEERILEDKNW